MSTNGLEIINHIFKLSDGTIAQVKFYDTNGTQRFRNVNESYYEKVDGCIVVYDITNQNSFDQIKNHFIPKIKENCKENIPTLILGNKTDINDKRKISIEEGEKLALENNFLFYEVSSIDNTNLNDIFKTIIEKTNNSVKIEEGNQNNNIIMLNEPMERNTCLRCC